MNRKRPDKQRSGLGGLFGLVAVLSMAMTIGQFIATNRAAPDTSVRIAATLVSWGLTTNSLSVGVRADEIDRHVALIRNPDGEERVQAADWLASRGVRDAGPHIAAAMAALRLIDTMGYAPTLASR